MTVLLCFSVASTPTMSLLVLLCLPTLSFPPKFSREGAATFFCQVLFLFVGRYTTELYGSSSRILYS